MASTKATESTPKKASSAKKAAPKSSATEKAAKPAASRKKTLKPAIITSDERYKMIEVAAYYIAEKNGFASQTMDHWLQAEQEIDAKLNA